MAAVVTAATVPAYTGYIAASVGPTKRTDTSTEIGGLYDFDTKNRFAYYQQLASCTPHISTSLNKLAQSLVKGMKFDGKTREVNEFKKWAARVNFEEQMQTVARLLFRDGTFVATFAPNPENFRIYPALMPYLTILPEGVQPGDTAPDKIMQPDPALFVIYEGEPESKRVILKPDQVIYGTYNAYDSVQLDVRGRKTYGLYGASMLDPIEPTARNLLNVTYGYVNFVKRYGVGRFHYDHTLLEELVKMGKLDIKAAGKIHKEWLENMKNLSENEDISAVGIKITPLDAAGSLNVQEFKASLEKDIQIGLLQSPLTMGDSKGSTYAAGYVAEADRLVAMEGLQKILCNLGNEILAKRSELMGKNPESVTMSFEQLSLPELPPDVLLEMYNSGLITEQEARERTGFQPNKPLDSISVKPVTKPNPDDEGEDE